jgi:biotin operon repressor
VDIEVWLPAVGAPTGKALDDTELRLVSWTIEHPDDQAHTPAPQKRRHQLLRLLDQAEEQGAVPSSEHLAQALAVSASTVRRDLAELRRAGYDATSRGQRRRAS